jgi:hypothetical protein
MGRPVGLPKTGGRKKGTASKGNEIVQGAMAGWALNYGIPQLQKIALDKETPVTVVADVLKYLIDRELGRPRQALDHSGSLDLEIVMEAKNKSHPPAI